MQEITVSLKSSGDTHELVIPLKKEMFFKGDPVVEDPVVEVTRTKKEKEEHREKIRKLIFEWSQKCFIPQFEGVPSVVIFNEQLRKSFGQFLKEKQYDLEIESTMRTFLIMFSRLKGVTNAQNNNVRKRVKEIKISKKFLSYYKCLLYYILN